MRTPLALALILGTALTARPALAQPALTQGWLSSGQPLPTGAPQAPGVAPAAPAALAPAPWARFNRFAFGLSFGFGSAGMDRLHALGDVSMQRNSLGGDTPKSGIQLNAEVALRYYFPYYVMAQVGYGTLWNKASSKVTQGAFSGTLYNDNLVMEVPILIGGYYPFIERLYAFGAVGPSVYFFPRSFWDIDPGGAPDFKADPGVGFHALLGADFLVSEVFAVGLELRYRSLKTGDLKEKNTGTAAHDFLGGEPYDLDFSGVSLALWLRFYVI